MDLEHSSISRIFGCKNAILGSRYFWIFNDIIQKICKSNFFLLEHAYFFSFDANMMLLVLLRKDVDLKDNFCESSQAQKRRQEKACEDKFEINQ